MCSENILTKLCRLCSLEIEYGFDIFIESDVKASLVILINKYLPIKVTEDDTLPKQICESCHIGVAATVDLIDRMVEGQHRLRKLHRKYISKLNEVQMELSEACEGAVPKEDYVLNLNEYKNSDSSIPQDQKYNNINISTSTTQNEILSQNDIKYPTDTVFMKEKDAPTKIESETSLINIQGNSPAIEMNDLAKGTEVRKVYESHPLGLVVEGKIPKRKRGRPRKEAAEGNHISKRKTQESMVDVRPKRNRNLPSRFRDTLAGKEFDKLLMNDLPSDGFDAKNVEEGFPEGEYSPCTKTRTHTLEGNTVVVTQNHQDESYKLPEAVNIELDFNETNFNSEETDENGVPKFSHTPKASVSSVQESIGLDPIIDIQKYLKPERKRRGPRRKFKYFCEFCNRGFQHIGRYWFHLKNHKTVVLQCDECKSRFSSKEDVILHQNISEHKGIGVIELENDDNLSIRCPLCQCRTFLTLERYRAHVSNMHEGQKPFVCTLCNKRFAYKHSLKTHHFTHQPEENKKRYSCKDCNKEFFHQSSLLYHKDTRHNTDRRFVCIFCNASFKHKQLLRRHLAIHSDRRPFVCKLCGSSFKTKGNLYNHMNIHTKSKVYTCGVCSKKFGHVTSLQLHLRSHTGEKPYACSYCGKKFSQNGNLQEHIRIHTGQKPYTCSLCDKKFTTSSQLSLHEKRHRSEYKYNCPECLKGFFSSESLRNHEKKHKNVSKAFSCDLCPKSFVDKAQLTKHSKSHVNLNDKIPTVETSVECRICNKMLSDEFMMVKHLEEHQLDKTWFIGSTCPTAGEISTMESAGQDIIYVLPKKEEPNLEFLPFNTDEIFEEQERDQLPSVNSVVATTIPSNFNIPHSNEKITVSDGKVFPMQNQLQVSETGFEISLKEEESLPFGITVCEDSSIYVKRVFNS